MVAILAKFTPIPLFYELFGKEASQAWRAMALCEGAYIPYVTERRASATSSGEAYLPKNGVPTPSG